MTAEQQQEIKQINEYIIKEKGYRVSDSLPILDSFTLRDISEIKGRMSVMNALLNIAFEAPTYYIKEWIEQENLSDYLSASEIELLTLDNEELSELELNSLSWYTEGLWALMWLCEMVEELNPAHHVADYMVSLLPNLEQEENNEKINTLSSLRTPEDSYKMLDFYYRLHWYCVDERLKGNETLLNEGIIYERRKALEWVFNPSADWDHVEMGT